MLNKVKTFFQAKQQQQQFEEAKDTQEMEYIVQPGDTLFGISLTFDMNVWRLKQLNGIDENNFYPGMKIKVQVDQEIKGEQQVNQKSLSEEHYQHTITRKTLLDLNIQITINYKTEYGGVQGQATLTFDRISFIVDKKKLKHLILKSTNKKENQVVESKLIEYNFEILLREIYKELYIYFWGVAGLPIPLTIEKEVALMRVVLQPNARTQQYCGELVSLFNSKVNSADLDVMEIISYIIYVLLHDHINVIEDSLNKLLLPFLDYEVKPFLCESNVTYYDLLTLEEISKQTGEEIIQMEKEDLVSKLIPNNSKILKNEIRKNIISSLPQYLQSNNWFAVYSPSVNGTSYFEFLRRTEDIGPHIVILKDQESAIFGGFVTESWKLTKNKFYGTGESFLFSFKDQEFKTFKSTQKNQYFQMADESGISFGAGDRYGLYIHHELTTGNSFPCETYDNEILAKQNEFQILQLEVWCFDQNIINNIKMMNLKKSLFH